MSINEDYCALFVRTDVRFSHEYVTPMSAIFFEEKVGPDGRISDPDSVLFFRDHLTFLHKVMSQERIEEIVQRTRAGGEALALRGAAGALGDEPGFRQRHRGARGRMKPQVGVTVSR